MPGDTGRVGGALGLTLMAARPRNQPWLDTPTGPLAVQIHGEVLVQGVVW